MYTQCPHCETVFAVQEWQLEKTEGVVTCGMCNRAFNGAERLRHELPPGLDEGAPETAEEESAPEEPTPVGPPRTPYSEEITRELFDQWAAQGMDFTRTGRAGAEDEEVEEIHLARAGVDEQGPARTEASGQAGASGDAAATGRKPRKRRPALWGFVIVVLLAGAVIQGTYLFRDTLASEPALRAWVETVCNVLGCSIAAAFDPAYLHVEERWLERHPQREGMYVLGAVLVNRAERPLHYPELGLELVDLDGHPLKEQWFAPHQYLGDGRLRARLDHGMPPGVAIPVRVVFEAPDEGPESFSLAFRQHAPDA